MITLYIYICIYKYILYIYIYIYIYIPLLVFFVTYIIEKIRSFKYYFCYGICGISVKSFLFVLRIIDSSDYIL